MYNKVLIERLNSGAARQLRALNYPLSLLMYGWFLFFKCFTFEANTMFRAYFQVLKELKRALIYSSSLVWWKMRKVFTRFNEEWCDLTKPVARFWKVRPKAFHWSVFPEKNVIGLVSSQLLFVFKSTCAFSSLFILGKFEFLCFVPF